MKRLAIVASLAAVAALIGGPTASACPFCTAPSLTLSEQAGQSDAVLLVAWKSGTKGTTADGTPDRGSNAATTFTIKEVMKGPLKVGSTVKIAGYQPAKAGDLFLLTGLGKDVIEWDLPAEFSETAFRYLAAAPKPLKADGSKIPARERLPYFVKFLEFPEETVANDAYFEFSNAAYDDIVAAKGSLPRERIRGWVTDPNTPPARMGLYGLLLGLCGTDDDAAAMATLITKPTTDFRIGLDGVMGGYMLLTGGPGLDLIRETKLENEFLVGPDGKPILDADGKKTPVPFSEVYSAMQAVRFMWSYGGGKLTPEQLRGAMRTLLDRPELADFAIADLARWKDWSVEDRLFKLYESEPYQVPGIKRSIVKYYLTAAKDVPEGASDAQLPEHATKAKRYLAQIEKQDPETVESVRQFLILVQ